MSVREIVKQSEMVVGAVRDLRKLQRRFASTHSAIKGYLNSHAVRKLHLGAGHEGMPGWLSTDIDRGSPEVVYLDATKPFPLPDASFDYIFSEHMIEHISWQQGLFMLRECRRILKPGGVIRVATPDLEVLLGLYKNQDASPMAHRYIEWISDRYLNGIRLHAAAFVINNAFRNWGHQFLYDGDLLALAMRETGFNNILRTMPGKSAHEHLRGLERHGKNVGNEEVMKFETMVFEAVNAI